MRSPVTLTYEVHDRVARITLDRPARGNGITLTMPGEIAACVEEANLDPRVHVIALAGNGKGFCGGYDLVESAEGAMEGLGPAEAPDGSPLDPAVQARNHDPSRNWDPVIDYQMMSRNLRGFMPRVCIAFRPCAYGPRPFASATSPTETQSRREACPERRS